MPSCIFLNYKNLFEIWYSNNRTTHKALGKVHFWPALFLPETVNMPLLREGTDEKEWELAARRLGRLSLFSSPSISDSRDGFYTLCLYLHLNGINHILSLLYLKVRGEVKKSPLVCMLYFAPLSPYCEALGLVLALALLFFSCPRSQCGLLLARPGKHR